MESIYKEYEDLEFTDNFMFVKIMYHNPDLCRELAEKERADAAEARADAAEKELAILRAQLALKE